MSAHVTAVVLCGDRLETVLDTLANIRDAGSAAEVVLVTDPASPPAADEWLASLRATAGARTVRLDATTPGAGRNAGIAAGDAPLVCCLDAGDALSPGYLQAAVQCFEAGPEVTLVTSGVRAIYQGEIVETAPSALDLETLAGALDAAHPATVFRRDRWEALGGFDETMAALEDADFWMRALEHGGTGVVLADLPLLRPMRPQSKYRRGLDDTVHAAAVERLLERRSGTFRRHVAAALEHRERRLFALLAPYRQKLDRRDALVAELARVEAALKAARESATPAAGGSAPGRYVTPVSPDWGYDRGVPVDRHYIEAFLERHAADIAGVVLEVQEADYTQRFGRARVTRSEVVDLNAANPRATIVGDLRSLGHVGSAQFDCIILTQTIHVIPDMTAVLAECARLLKPGGVLLSTLPCASRVCLEYGADGDFWRVTEAGARRLFATAFAPSRVEVRGHGNVAVTTAFLQGLALHELTPEQLAFHDPYNPTLVSVRATRAPIAADTRSARGDASSAEDGAAILLYHRVTSLDRDVHGLAVPPRIFREQMERLRRDREIVSLEDLAAGLAVGRVRPRSVAVTFDDGYADNLLEASEILLALDVPATFFVTTAALDTAQEYWWDTLERALLGAGTRPANLRLRAGAGEVVCETSTPDRRRAAHDALYGAILPLAADARDEAITALVRWAGIEAAAPANRRLTAGELRALSSRPGHAIGAHTARHLLLTAHPPTVALDEMRASRVALERLLSRPVTSLAYPFGAWNLRLARLAAEAGFTRAVTCDRAPVTSAAHPLGLARFDVAGGLPPFLRPAG